MNDLKLYESVPKDKFPIFMKKRTIFPANFSSHWHEHIEIIFVFDGNITIRCGDDLIRASKNDCVIINANDLHAGISSEKCMLGTILIPPDFFDYAGLYFENLIRDPFLTSELERIFEFADSYINTRYLEIKGRMYLLLVYLIENYSNDTFIETQYLPYSKKSKRIDDAIKYIAQNYTDNITTDFLARLSNTSNSYFCHIFKEVTGKSAKDYINELRIDKSTGLLKTTDMTITEIASQCGFSDINYFARCFKKVMRISPSQYRKSN